MVDLLLILLLVLCVLVIGVGCYFVELGSPGPND